MRQCRGKFMIQAILSLVSYSACSLIIFFLFNSCLYGAESPVWVEAEGEAYLGETETRKEAMERAKADAQKKAVEEATGTFIRGHTIVSNSQVADDLAYASVRGRVKNCKVIRGWWDKEKDIYRVKIKALVEPIYPDKEKDIVIRLSLSKDILKEGEEARIYYQANVDCYAYLFSVASDGSVTLLVPNSLQKDNFIRGNKAYEFPPKDSPIRLQARFLPNFSGNEAEEKVKLIATKKKEDILPLGFHEGMFKIYDAKSTGMISLLRQKLAQLEPADWAESVVTYRLRR